MENPTDDPKVCLACVGAPDAQHTCACPTPIHSCPCPALPEGMVVVDKRDYELATIYLEGLKEHIWESSLPERMRAALEGK